MCIIVAADTVDDVHLTVNTDMLTIVRAMAKPNSGLEIRDRLWLKITIPNAFIGKPKLCFCYSVLLHNFRCNASGIMYQVRMS